jgi:hypothetical protein
MGEDRASTSTRAALVQDEYQACLSIFMFHNTNGWFYNYKLIYI